MATLLGSASCFAGWVVAQSDSDLAVILSDLYQLVLPAAQVRSTLPSGVDVLAFQCRNPIHKAHYELFTRALDADNVGRDSVCLVHPTCGPTQVRHAALGAGPAAVLAERIKLMMHVISVHCLSAWLLVVSRGLHRARRPVNLGPGDGSFPNPAAPLIYADVACNMPVGS